MADQKACPSNLVSSPLHSETERIPLSSSGALDPHWVPVPSPAFHESMVKLEKVAREDRDGDEENYKGCGLLRPRTKQRRLSDHQVQFLESSFDEENKLEPERKAQLARKLGLQSRQVAIWFQNRRARLKTKQLEKEYIELKNSYDKLKTEFDCLLKEREQLKEEVLSLKDKLLIKGKEKQAQSSSVQLEPVSSVNISERQKSNTGIDKELPDWNPVSGHNQALLLEPANSSHAFEPDSSDFSQEEGDNLNFPMPEHGAYVASPASSSGFAFTAELEQELWSWPY